MNKKKVSKKLLNNVSILSQSKQKILILSNNFSATKKTLKDNKFQFKTYRFVKSFCIDADYDDIDFLSEIPNIDYIYSNPTVKTESLEQEQIRLANLTEQKFFGQNQTICFIDTGIFPHLDFIFPKCRIIKFIDFINHYPLPYDDNGHGTFVAGIACGGGIFQNSYKGFSPKANIIAIKALSKSGNSSSNVILDAMQWVYENHRAYNINVVCMSFGADVVENDPLSFGADALWKKGVIVVAAAGNSGPNAKSIKSPGTNPNIITVGAYDIEKSTVAEFSSRGPTLYGHKPDLLAPAVNLTSCSTENPFYTEMSGTSVATPVIAGICADIKSKFPEMTNNEIKKYLISNCKIINGNKDSEGAGFLQF